MNAKAISGAVLNLVVCAALSGGISVLSAQPAQPPSPHFEATPAINTSSSSVGFLPATFRVDESGAANYSIPIVVAPGSAGVQPDLALSYNSRSPNSPLGPGWSVGGLSSIARCKQSTEHGDGPGPFDGINFDDDDSNDAYCLDGQRLLAVTSSNLCPSAAVSGITEFRLELDTATRVCGYVQDSDKYGYTYWTVMPRDGSIRRYGRNGSSLRPNNGTSVREFRYVTWAIDTIADSAGNAIQFEYMRNEQFGEMHIAQVRYGARVSVASGAELTQVSAPYARVQFIYEALPLRAQRQDWIDGSRFTLSNRLNRIESYGPINSGTNPDLEALIRRYELGYRTSATGSGRSRLISVRECAPSQPGSQTMLCQPRTRLEWLGSGAADAAPPQGFSFIGQGSYAQVFRRNADYKVGDVNGDGRQDMVWIEDRNCSGGGISEPDSPQRFRFHVSTATGSSGTTELGSPFATAHYLHRSEQPACSTGATLILGTLWFLYDFTGDGRDDLLMPTGGTPGGTWKVFPAISAGNGQWTFSSSPAQIIDTGIPGQPWHDAYFADFTGDGLPDLLSPHGSIGTLAIRPMERAPASSPYAFRFSSNSIGVDLYVPSGAPPGCVSFWYSRDPRHRGQLGDVDGDGRADLLVRYTATCTNLRESGLGFASITEIEATRINGCPDPLCEVRVQTYVLRASNFDAQNRLVFANHQFVGETSLVGFEPGNLVGDPGAVQLIDINGDGLSDLLYRKTDDGINERFHYRLSNGRSVSQSGFSAESSVIMTLPSDQAKTVIPIDINGDQRTDLMYVDSVGGLHTLRARLFDRDGFNTLVEAAPGTLLNSQDPQLHGTYFIDLDGNGAPDLLRFHAQSNTLFRTRAAQAFGGNDLLTRVDNGIGARTLITYGLLTNASFYERYSDGPRKDWGRNSPVYDVFAPLWAVRSARSSAPTANLPDAMSTINYRYAGARIQSGGRGFLGFAWVVTEDPQSGLATSTEYRQDFPFTGRPVRTIAETYTPPPGGDPCVLDPTLPGCFAEPPCPGPLPCEPRTSRPFTDLGRSGVVISDATSTWNSRPAWNPAVAPQPILVWLESSNELKNELDGDTSHRILSEFVVDKYGNPRSTTVVHYEGAIQHRGAVRQTRGTENSYGCTATPVSVDDCIYPGLDPPNVGFDDERVRLGRLSLTGIVTDRFNGAPPSNRRVSFEYDPSTLQLVAEIQGPYGDIITNPDERKRLELRTDYELDSFGNRTEAVQCSVHHYPNRTACQDLTGFQQRQWEGDPTRIQRYVKSRYDTHGRFVLANRKPFYSETASGNVNEQDSGRTGVTNDGLTLAMTPLGQPLMQWDANGVLTEIAYDGFGRARFQRSAVGAFAKTLYAWCVDIDHPDVPASPRVACPIGASYRVEANSQATSGIQSGRSVAPRAFSYHDRLGREVLRTSEMFQGSNPSPLWSSVATAYDSLARGKTTSVPYFSRDPLAGQSGIRPGAPLNGVAPDVSTVDYDELARVIRMEQPEQPKNGLNETLFEHDKLSSTMIYPKDNPSSPQEATTVKNPMGEVASYLDRGGLFVSYGYDAVGNVQTISRTPATGPLAGQIITTTQSFDVHGRKIAMSDPDKGDWTYEYNALGEVIGQQDARAQNQQLRYDALGRPWKRSQTRLKGGSYLDEPDTLWSYDTEAVGTTGRKALGLPAHEELELDGFLREYRYDNFGRPVSTLSTLDGLLFTQRATYDAFGRVFQQFDASRDGNSAHGTLTEYSNQGHPLRIREAASGLVGTVYHEILDVDARGNITFERRGGRSDLETQRIFDAGTGRLTSLTSGFNGAFQAWSYGWDKHNNLTWRWNQASGLGFEGAYDLREDFEYDLLDRLEVVRLTRFNGVAVNQITMALSYDPLGNITSKTGIGSYHYANRTPQHAGMCAVGPVAGPHAVRGAGNKSYCYDENGNQTQSWRNGKAIRNIVYTGAGQVEWVEHKEPLAGLARSVEQFWYGPDRSRWKRESDTESEAGNSKWTTYYIGNVEYRSACEVRRTIAGVAVITVRDGPGCTLPQPLRTDYLLTDHLGSVDVIVPVVAGALGQIQRLSFSAHGQRRQAAPSGSSSLWQLLSIPEAAAYDNNTTTRGFTGHEHIDGSGLVHMNGRVYDPELGRFIQADNILDPGDLSQGLNRYSYVLNNPLSGTDPTGTITLRQVIGIAVGVTAMIISGGMATGALGPIMGMSAAASSFTVAVAGGFIAGAISTNSLQGGFWGAFSAAVFWGIGYHGGDWGDRTTALANGTAGGVLNELQGGKFGHGFLSAAASSAINPAIQDQYIGTQIAVSAVVGGTVSSATGGKFANGAVTAAFSYAFASAASRGGSASEWTAEDAMASGAANSVYGDTSGGMLGELGIEYSPSSGFQASLSGGDGGPYILAFAGTSPTSLANWRANAGQAVGLGSSQYDQAINLAGDVWQRTGGNVIFTGHSLGGGLASAAAYATGGRAITFNAAGLHSMYRNGSPGAIRAHYIRGDILTTVQRWTPLPNAAGTPIPHSARWYQGPIQRHLMGRFP